LRVLAAVTRAEEFTHFRWRSIHEVTPCPRDECLWRRANGSRLKCLWLMAAVRQCYAEYRGCAIETKAISVIQRTTNADRERSCTPNPLYFGNREVPALVVPRILPSRGLIEMRKNSSFPALIFIVITGIGAAFAYSMNRVSGGFAGAGILGATFVLAFVVSSAVQVADQWSKAVVLRLGKFHSLQGPGAVRDCSAY
jgi:hypothetical protein